MCLTAVGAGLGHGVDHHAHRSALRRIEPVGDEFELGDRVAAVPRLAEVAPAMLLVTCWPSMLIWNPTCARGIGDLAAGIGSVPRREQCQVEPVAAVEGKFLDLALVDVAAYGERSTSMSGASPLTVIVSCIV